MGIFPWVSHFWILFAMDTTQEPRTASLWASPDSEASVASSSLVDARVWFDQTPVRFAAGWTVLAAVLAVQPLAQTLGDDLLRIALLFLLADPLWGSLWGLMNTPGSLPVIQASLRRNRIWLPYLHPGSPAAHLLGLEGPGMLALVMRVAVPGFLLALLVAGFLGPWAVSLTLVALGLSIAGWLHRHVDLIPQALLHSLMTVALPWVLVILVLRGPEAPMPQFLWAALWTLHAWGAARLAEEPGDRVGLGGLAVAQAGVTVALILLRAPLWVVPVVACWLPTWLLVLRGGDLRGARFWWIAAMLLSTMALTESDMGAFKTS